MRTGKDTSLQENLAPGRRDEADGSVGETVVDTKEREVDAGYIGSIIRAADYIESHLGEELDLDSVCKSAHLSKFYFSRIFHATVGESVFSYIRKRRLTEIAERLVTTDQPILELAFQFGYESQQSMTKSFRKRYGESPGMYRKAGKRRYFFERPQLSLEAIGRLKNELTLGTHVFSLPLLRIVGERETMPINDPTPVECTRSRFRRTAPAIEPLRRHRGVFEVTLMRHEEIRQFAPEDTFDGLIGYALPPDAHTDGSYSEVTLPASRYITFHYRGDDSIGRLSSLYSYIFSSGIAARRESLADRAFFHYYRPGSSSMLFFLPID